MLENVKHLFICLQIVTTLFMATNANRNVIYNVRTRSVTQLVETVNRVSLASLEHNVTKV
jgi:hypothetical protein